MTTEQQYRRVKEIFLRLVDQDPQGWPEALEEACQGDKALRSEVEALLSLAEAPTGPLALASGGNLLDPPVSLQDEVDSLLTELKGWDRFVDLEPVGAGGMGVVFRAVDPRLKRTIALKFLLRGGSATAERFRKEAELQARVRHRNVLEVYETGEAVGPPYLAMRFVDGPPLGTIFSSLTEDACLLFLEEIAQGVQAAHDLGLIHRDIKPANVLVEKSSLGWHPYVTDFGIAREAQGEDPPDSQGGGPWGSPRYMAPEQLDPAAPLDVRVDIYGLGATFYEFLSGRPLFPETTLLDLLVRIHSEPPTPLAEIRPEIPPPLAALVMRCLEKDRDRRYPSAKVLAAELRRLQQRSRRRRRLTVIASTGAALGLGIAGLLFFFSPEDPAEVPVEVSSNVLSKDLLSKDLISRSMALRPAVVVLAPRDVTGGPETAWIGIALQEMLLAALDSGGDLRLIPSVRLGTLVSGKGDPSFQELRQRFAVDGALRGTYRIDGEGPSARILVSVFIEGWEIEGWETEEESPSLVEEEGQVGELAELAQGLAERLWERMVGEEISDLQRARAGAFFSGDPEAARLHAEGLYRLRLLDPRGAGELFLRALATSPDHPLLHLALSRSWEELGFDERAHDEANKALARSEELGAQQRQEIEAHLHSLAGEWQEAMEGWRSLWNRQPDEIEYGLRLAAVQGHSGAPGDVMETVHLLRELPEPLGEDPRIDFAEANAAADQGSFQESLAAARRVQKKAEASGLPHLSARARLLETWALQNLGRLPEALQAAEEARIISSAAGDLRTLGSSLALIAGLQRIQGNLSAAIEIFEEALVVARRRGDRFLLGVIHNNLATALADAGDLQRALGHYEEGRVLALELNRPTKAAVCVMNMANLETYRGEFEASLELYRDALTVFREAGDRRNEAFCLANASGALLEIGEDGEAARFARRSLEIGQEIGVGASQALPHQVLGRTAATRGDRALAAEHFEEAVMQAQGSGSQEEILDSLLSFLRFRLEEGQIGAARKLLEEARREIFGGPGRDHGEEVESSTAWSLEIAAAEVATAEALAAGGRCEADSGDETSPEDVLAIAWQARDEGLASIALEARLAAAGLYCCRGEEDACRDLFLEAREEAESRGWVRKKARVARLAALSKKFAIP